MVRVTGYFSWLGAIGKNSGVRGTFGPRHVAGGCPGLGRETLTVR